MQPVSLSSTYDATVARKEIRREASQQHDPPGPLPRVDPILPSLCPRSKSASTSSPFGMLGSLFGMGGSSSNAPPPSSAPPSGGMRGPKHVDDILKDLHRDAFKQEDVGGRVEIISNASDSDVSEMIDVTATTSKKKAPGGGRGRGRPRKSN